MFDLILKNLNLDCYLVMIAARRASLSSDNSCYEQCKLNTMFWCMQKIIPCYQEGAKKTPINLNCAANYFDFLYSISILMFKFKM